MTALSLSDLGDVLLKLTSAISCCRVMANSMESEEDTSALYFLASGLDKIHDDIGAFYDATSDAARSTGPCAVS